VLVLVLVLVLEEGGTVDREHQRINGWLPLAALLFEESKLLPEFGSTVRRPQVAAPLIP